MKKKHIIIIGAIAAVTVAVVGVGGYLVSSKFEAQAAAVRAQTEQLVLQREGMADEREAQERRVARAKQLREERAKALRSKRRREKRDAERKEAAASAAAAQAQASSAQAQREAAQADAEAARELNDIQNEADAYNEGYNDAPVACSDDPDVPLPYC